MNEGTAQQPDEPRVTEPAMVFVVDDDEQIRILLKRQLLRAGYRVETFESAQTFLERPRFDGHGCVLLDIFMPGMSGVELQAAMCQAGNFMPIIFVTGCDDLATCVNVMKKGADNFLTKPFDKETLLAAVRVALTNSREKPHASV